MFIYRERAVACNVEYQPLNRSNSQLTHLYLQWFHEVLCEEHGHRERQERLRFHRQMELRISEAAMYILLVVCALALFPSNRKPGVGRHTWYRCAILHDIASQLKQRRSGRFGENPHHLLSLVLVRSYCFLSYFVGSRACVPMCPM